MNIQLIMTNLSKKTLIFCKFAEFSVMLEEKLMKTVL
jgi:hypothetical protein